MPRMNHVISAGTPAEWGVSGAERLIDPDDPRHAEAFKTRRLAELLADSPEGP